MSGSNRRKPESDDHVPLIFFMKHVFMEIFLRNEFCPSSADCFIFLSAVCILV